MLYNTIIRMCSDPVESQDILQETFIKIFRSLRSFRNEASFKSWIKRIAINHAISHFRNQKKQWVEISGDHQNLEMVTSHSDFDTNYQIQEAIKRLPNGSRIIFSLYAIEGYSHKEIADQLHISISTSKTQYRRAKILLQKHLKPLIHESGC